MIFSNTVQFAGLVSQQMQLPWLRTQMFHMSWIRIQQQMKKTKNFSSLNLEVRKKMYQAIIDDPSNADNIPVVIELHPLSQIQTNSFIKFNVSKECKIFSVLQKVRQRLKDNEYFKKKATLALYLFSQGKMLMNTELIKDQLHRRNQEDGFLYFDVAETETF